MAKKDFIEIDVLNTKAIANSIRKIGDNEMLKELRKANKEAAQIFIPAIQQRTPIGVAVKRGKRLHQTARAAGSRTGAKVLVGGGRHYYAWFVHAGHAFKGGKGRYRGVPFFREGVKAKMKDFWPIYQKRMSKVIKEFNRKHG